MKKYFFLFFFINVASPLFASDEGAVSVRIHWERLGSFISEVLDADPYETSDDEEINENTFLQRLNEEVEKNPSLNTTFSLSEDSSIKVTLSQQEADFALVTKHLFEVGYAVGTKKTNPHYRLTFNLATRCRMGREDTILKKFGPIGKRYLDVLEQRLLAAGLEPSRFDRPISPATLARHPPLSILPEPFLQALDAEDSQDHPDSDDSGNGDENL